MKLILHTSILTFTFAGQLAAQVGVSNPTGPAGIFNGQIATACNYDPYTANASRVVRDLDVAGVAGVPLSLFRISNSRDTGGSIAFGLGGGWHHSFQWVHYSSPEYSAAQSPTQYSVQFPDGRFEVFATPETINPNYLRSTPGIGDRYFRLNLSTMKSYLVQTDGSKVEFTATQHSYNQNGHLVYYYTYVATALIDPHGLSTTITYDGNGRLWRVTDPAPGGRYIQFNWGQVGNFWVITSVSGSNGRTATYSYVSTVLPGATLGFTRLDSVTYNGDSQWTAHYKYCVPNIGSPNQAPLLKTCDDPMYQGPMKRIGYVYRTSATNYPGSNTVFGQLQSENYYDGNQDGNLGVAVSTLTIDSAVHRVETRPFAQTREFYYSAAGYITWVSDFAGHWFSQGYDTNMFVNWTKDAYQKQTDMTRNSLTGAVQTITFPATAGDTPPNTPRGHVSVAYGWASCDDPNNRDDQAPYYVCSTTDEAGHITKYSRDINKRVTRIDYPDGGYETFAYDSFGRVTANRAKTGGTYTIAYDAREMPTEFRDPYHQSGAANYRYKFDPQNDLLTDITDVFGTAVQDPNHSTSFLYDAAGKILRVTHPPDPSDETRHYARVEYNADGTIQNSYDELNNLTSFTYDDYKRVTSITTPLRYVGDPTPRTTNISYATNVPGDRYYFADSKPTYVTLPSTKQIKTIYDDNRRFLSVESGYGTADSAISSYGYDNNGNLVSTKTPNEQPQQLYANRQTTYILDERGRVASVQDAGWNTTSYLYDSAGRIITITRPNGQVITNDSFDAGNRVLQRTVSQLPGPDAVTKFTYYTPNDGTSAPVGMLKTMQDPRLVQTQSANSYGYVYDLMGRPQLNNYPDGTHEYVAFDLANRIQTYLNRSGYTETLTYDALNRLATTHWNDAGVTPDVTYLYDIASRLTDVNNANASIHRDYMGDGLLRWATEDTTAIGGASKVVGYTYDADGNRLGLTAPAALSLSYDYTNRNQLKTIYSTGVNIGYVYDVNGNIQTRSVENMTSTTYTVDALDRITHIAHTFPGSVRTFDYDYDSVSNRKWVKRDGTKGDVFGYDYNSQITAVKLNITNPDTTSVGPQTIVYDTNGNRQTFSAYGPTDTYTVNDLGQYVGRNMATAAYNANGDMTIGLDNSYYTFDSQDRLVTASKGSSVTFKYDGLGRQVSNTINGVSTFNVWDGWSLLEEYQGTSTLTQWVRGADGLVQQLTTATHYYSDGTGSTAFIANGSGAIRESYRYDLQGTPSFFGPSGKQLSASAYGIADLFNGERWYTGLGLYDLRNRFYSPDIGRFLSADPIGFAGDATNLYRYCGNNPASFADPLGLDPQTKQKIGEDHNDIIVRGDNIPESNIDDVTREVFSNAARDYFERLVQYYGEHGITGHDRDLPGRGSSKKSSPPQQPSVPVQNNGYVIYPGYMGPPPNLRVIADAWRWYRSGGLAHVLGIERVPGAAAVQRFVNDPNVVMAMGASMGGIGAGASSEILGYNVVARNGTILEYGNFELEGFSHLALADRNSLVLVKNAVPPHQLVQGADAVTIFQGRIIMSSSTFAPRAIHLDNAQVLLKLSDDLFQ